MSFPEIIEIQLHNKCNSFCSICPYEKYSKLKKKCNMKTDLRDKIFSDIYENQNKIKRIIPYFNNEPFADNKFIDILRWFRKNTPNISIEVSTNLSLCSEQKIETILKENLIDDLRISFFGGCEKTYKKMMPNLNFQENLKNLQFFLDAREKINSNFSYMLIMVMLPQIDILAEKKMLDEKIINHKINYHFFGYIDRAEANNILNEKKIKTSNDFILNGCSLNRNTERLCIDVNGNAVLCSQDWFSEAIIGSLSKSSIYEIWNGDARKKINAIIQGEASSPCDFICRRCKLAKIKANDVVMLNFNGDRYMTDTDKKKITP